MICPFLQFAGKRKTRDRHECRLVQSPSLIVFPLSNNAVHGLWIRDAETSNFQPSRPPFDLDVPLYTKVNTLKNTLFNMAPPSVDYSVYLVTDSTPAILGDKDLVAVVKAAVEGGG